MAADNVDVTVTLKAKGAADIGAQWGADIMRVIGRTPFGPIAAGAVAGGIAGGAIGFLKEILDVLVDFPMIAGVMKMFKLILTLLLLPLIPILKPVLVGLGKFVQVMLPLMISLMNYVESYTQFMTELGKTIGAFEEETLKKSWKILCDAGQWLMDNIIKPGFEAIRNAGAWLWEWVVVYGWSKLQDAGEWIWTNILLPAWTFLSDVGSKIWNTILKPAWNFLSDVGNKIWTDILKPAWDFLSDVGQKIWDDIIEPAWDPFVKALQSAADWLNHLWHAITGGGENGDFLMRPGQAPVKFSPDDTVIGFKGGLPNSGGTFNFSTNISNPIVRSDDDIKRIVKEISLEQQRQFRRYVSYV